MEDIADMSGQQMGERRPPTLTVARRRELIHYAEKLATEISKHVQEHELCFLRRAVEMFVER